MISIIGAGPSGNYLAYLLAKSKSEHEVNVYEEHSEIGKPIQCTGIVTNSFAGIIKPHEDFVVNTVDRVEVNSPNKEKFEIKIKKNIILDRHKFDAYLANKAIDAGAKYHLNHRFVDCDIKHAAHSAYKYTNANSPKQLRYNKITMKFRHSNSKSAKETDIDTDYLVGADGPFSRVAKSAGLYGNRRFINAPQVKAKCECDKSLFKVYLHKDYFGWIVPEDDKISRIGISGFNNINANFRSFLSQFISKEDILETQSGVVPLFSVHQKYQKNDVFLLGDAAAHTKATTHGGIIQGLMAAEELSNSILYNQDYQQLCMKRFGLDLSLHLVMREGMEQFSDNDLNYLVKLTNQSKINKILASNDRDYPSKIIFKAMINEPRYLYFARKLGYNQWKVFMQSILSHYSNSLKI